MQSSLSLALSALSRVTCGDSLRDMANEIEIEVFRADTRASRGITEADIADVAAFDCEANPVPVVIGHPKSDSPAEGVIKAFRAEGAKLFATLSGLSEKLVEDVKAKRLINRSMAFFGGDHEANPTPGKLAPRHLGFLGGAAPGIPGMSKLADAFSFSADGELAPDALENLIVAGEPAEAVLFEAPPTPVFTVKEEPKGMTEEELKAEADRIAEEKRQFEADKATFAAAAETSRKAGNKARVDGLVAAGKVLPADRAALETVFNALSSDELEFAADDKGFAVDKLVAILSKGPALVDTSGNRISPTGEKTFAATGNTANDAAAISSAARELMATDKSLTFEAAVARISNEQQEG